MIDFTAIIIGLFASIPIILMAISMFKGLNKYK